MSNALQYFLFSSILLCCCCFKSNAQQKQSKGEYYQLSIYHYQNLLQESQLHQYLKDAYLPALRRNGIEKIGVFYAVENDTATEKRLYVLVPIKKLEQLSTLRERINRDPVYQQTSASFLNLPYNIPAFQRLETIILHAFHMAPHFNIPVLSAPKNERVYELRSYESASEKLFQNKVHMFNEGGEIDLFKRLNFNAVFYASVIAGSKMPNLMYMTSFESKADRDQHWKTFREDAEWKQLSTMSIYQKNVSHSDIVFLHAAAYSDF